MRENTKKDHAQESVAGANLDSSPRPWEQKVTRSDWGSHSLAAENSASRGDKRCQSRALSASIGRVALVLFLATTSAAQY